MRRVLLLVLPVALLALGACGAPPPHEPWVDDMLGVVNAHRAEAGVAPLALCGPLIAAAQGHSDFQAATGRLTHTGEGGSTMRQRVESAGYGGWSGLGENVAAQHPDVGSVVAGWLASPDHRASLLSSSFTHAGFGLGRTGDGTPYWTQDFGRDGAC
ncbi:MAG: CAP domain-containing protein [Microthrixaceae bacterium]